MKHCKLVLMAVIAVVALAAMSGSALATTITPANTDITATSTNSKLDLAGATISCTSATISGNTGSGTATVRQITGVRLRWSGCTAFGAAANITPTGCDTTTVMDIGYVSSTNIWGNITLMSGCVIDISVPSFGCTSTVVGPQTIGNSTNGVGGISFDNTTHVATLNSPAVQVTAGGGFCSGGAGQMTGSYTFPTSVVVDP